MRPVANRDSDRVRSTQLPRSTREEFLVFFTLLSVCNPHSLKTFMGFLISPSPIWICFLFLLSFFCISATHAFPLDLAGQVSPVIIRSDGFTINKTQVTASSQGPATHASGTGFSASTLIWLCFLFISGTLMTLGSIHIERLVAGVGVGLVAATASKLSETKYQWNPRKLRVYLPFSLDYTCQFHPTSTG